MPACGFATKYMLVAFVSTAIMLYRPGLRANVPNPEALKRLDNAFANEPAIMVIFLPGGHK